ncbi:MAG: hypothetical protein AAGG53_18085, partial [Cyanobacteria bacterium P01_H01_bin.152]
MQEITWDNGGNPRASAFDDIYFSSEDGLAESRYVFLNQNHLAQRFSEVAPHGHFVVGETGFGTGLNCLACWQLWRQRAPKKGAKLHYLSVEKFPLSPQSMVDALAAWPELEPLQQRLIAAYQLSLCRAPQQPFHYFDLGDL